MAGFMGQLTDNSTNHTGSSVQVLPDAQGRRTYLLIVNNSTANVMYWNENGAAAASAGSVLLPINGGRSEYSAPNFVPQGAINVIGTNGQAYTVKSCH